MAWMTYASFNYKNVKAISKVNIKICMHVYFSSLKNVREFDTTFKTNNINNIA